MLRLYAGGRIQTSFTKRTNLCTLLHQAVVGNCKKRLDLTWRKPCRLQWAFDHSSPSSALFCAAASCTCLCCPHLLLQISFLFQTVFFNIWPSSISSEVIRLTVKRLRSFMSYRRQGVIQPVLCSRGSSLCSPRRKILQYRNAKSLKNKIHVTRCQILMPKCTKFDYHMPPGGS